MMPNWIEGTMKFRGKREDIKRFIDNGLKAVTIFGETTNIEGYIDDTSDDEYINVSFAKELYIKGTRRAFLQPCDVYMAKDYGVVIFHIKQAWSFTDRDDDEDRWQKISQEYNVDIRLYGIECGMEFTQEVIILKDSKLIINNVKQYEDWKWECPFPYMGG